MAVRLKREHIIGTAIVLAVVFGFLRCGDIWIEGPGGDGGTAGDGGAAGDGGTAGDGGFCGDTVCTGEEDVSTCAVDCDHDIVVVVEKAIAETLASSLEVYRLDLRREQRLARIEPWEPGTVEELKALLFEQVDRYGVEGAFLVGNLPAAFYEHRVICLAWDRLNRCVMYEYEEFPTDVYLQDRDAVWEDADGNGKYDGHGELELEIYVSRLQTLPDPIKCAKSELFAECPESYDPGEALYGTEECVMRCPSRLRSQIWQEYELGDVECCAPYFFRRYFERLHEYRTDGALVNRSAMVFADDDFIPMLAPTGLDALYPEVEVLSDAQDSTKDVYLDRLTNDGAELVHHFLHSSVRNLYFYNCTEWDEGQVPPECLSTSTQRLYRTDVSAGPFGPRYNLQVSFVNMYSCHASRFTEPNLAMAFTLQTDYGLATVGNTRKGGMKDATLFHGGLADGASWGESYRRWYNEVGRHDDRWYLGVVLTGDPTLTVRSTGDDRSLATQPSEGPVGIETPPELLAADPPETFEDYKRRNPQFFGDSR